MLSKLTTLARQRKSLPRVFSSWRNAILSVLIVLGGIGTALLTVAAQGAGDPELARLAAIASLVFVLLISIFVVPPLARSAALEIRWFDLPVKLTLGGALFIGLLCIVLFAAMNTGNNLLFLIFSLLASTLFVGWAAGRTCLSSLTVSARFPDHIFAGEPAPVIVTLHNTKRLLPSLSVLIKARMTEEVPKRTQTRGVERRRASRRSVEALLAYFIYVPRRKKIEQRVEQTFPARGHILITGFELTTRFPFNFFQQRRRLRSRDVDLVIYPKPEPLGDELHLLPINAGHLSTMRYGSGHDLYSLREYQPQDERRHVDWKATARAGHLMVREFTAEDERRVRIALDTRLHSVDKDGGESKAVKELSARFERSVTLAASLLQHFTNEGTEVGLTVGNESGLYGTGRDHLHSCLRRLALVSPDTGIVDEKKQDEFWQALITTSASNSSNNYVVLVTTTAPGSIPANLWRASHVIYV